MTLIEKIRDIARIACPTMTFSYDIRQMQNVLADDVQFPAIYFEEYYQQRLENRFGWHKIVSLELHFLDLVPMQGEALERDLVRNALMVQAQAFVDAVNADGTFREVTNVQCDPEPPMFDANATGVLLRITLEYPMCALL